MLFPALALSALLPMRVHAYCQSLSVVDASASVCGAPCLTLRDFTPEEIEERRIVPLRWERPCVTWTLHPDGTGDLPRADVVGAIERSFAAWTDTTCDGSPVGFEVTQRDVPDLRCRYIDHVLGEPNVSAILFAQDWAGRFNPPSAFALTNTWFDARTGEILGADLEINDERRAWAICPPEGCSDGRADLENVLVHEIGHWFGFAHTPDDELATMWACSDIGETIKRDLAADDIAGWCDLYADGLSGECPEEGDAPLECRFVGDECDPMRPSATCESGYCEDLGRGSFECTIPCALDDPLSCPEATECQEMTSGDLRCVSSGCGCRVVGRGATPTPWLLLGALVFLRRRR